MSTFASEEREKGFLSDKEKIFPLSKIFLIFDFQKRFSKKKGMFPQNNLTIKKMFIILKHYQLLDSYSTTSFVCGTEKEAKVLVTSLNLAKTVKTVDYIIAHVI